MPFEYQDVLAGPIVRRVEPGLAAVWLALRRPARVTLRVWEGLVTGNTSQAPLTEQTVQTRAIGAQLHFALATAVFTAPNRLRSDQLYSYDVVLHEPTTSPTTGQGFLALNLLRSHTLGSNPHLPLGYAENFLPGFVLPPTNIGQLKLLQGSCRLPHSSGEDAMTYLDDLFSQGEAYTKLDQRPHQLFLTGDQIYADEVAVEYLRLINTVGNQLLSGQPNQVIESLPFDYTVEGNARSQDIPLSLEWVPPARRQRLIRQAIKFTSGYGDSHVLGLGEYCALYLLSWSNVLWSADFFQTGLSDRWQRVQAYQTQWQTLRTQLKTLKDQKKLTDSQYETAKEKLPYYPAWRLLRPEWRKVDQFLTAEDRTAEWGTEAVGETPMKAPPDALEDLGGQTALAPHTVPAEAARAWAKMLTPSWFAGRKEMGFGDSHDDDTELYHDAILSELRRVQGYHAGLAKVRRLLANIPTYMTFDDHEVTDDWNLSGQWVQNVRGQSMGRAVERNALLAFGLCQAWGNDPLYFEPRTDNPTPGNRMLQLASQLFLQPNGQPRQMGPDTPTANELDQLFNLRAGQETLVGDRVRWHYRIGGPGYEVISLDTRTMRGYPAIDGPPQLMTAEAIQAQIPVNPVFSYAPAAGPGITVVIAAAPVLGFTPVEYILQPVVNKIDRLKLPPSGVFAPANLDYFTGLYDHDPEPWSYQEETFEALLARLANYGRVVFFSGDVHYSCALSLDYWRFSPNPAQPSRTRFIQLTSSALKNLPDEMKANLFQSGVVSRLAQALSPQRERMGWETVGRGAPLTPPAGQAFNRLVQQQVTSNPALIPVAALPVGTQQRYDPAWSWRLVLVPDGRPDSQRLAGISTLPALVEPSAPNAVDLGVVNGVGKRHFWQSLHAPARLVMFFGNAGLVTIKPNSPKPSLVYSLIHKLRSLPNSKPKAYTQFELALDVEGNPPRIP